MTEADLAAHYSGLLDFIHGYYHSDASCSYHEAVQTIYQSHAEWDELTYGDALRLLIIEVPKDYEQTPEYAQFQARHPELETYIRQSLRSQSQIGYAYSLQRVSLCSVARQLHWGIQSTLDAQKASAQRRQAIVQNVVDLQGRVREEYARKSAAQKAQQAAQAEREQPFYDDYLETMQEDQEMRRETLVAQD
jgi:hypothetical protein